MNDLERKEKQANINKLEQEAKKLKKEAEYIELKMALDVIRVLLWLGAITISTITVVTKLTGS